MSAVTEVMVLASKESWTVTQSAPTSTRIRRVEKEEDEEIDIVLRVDGK